MAGAGVPPTFLRRRGAASVPYVARLSGVAIRISREQERAADERPPCPRKRLLWAGPILDAGKWHKWAFARWYVLTEGRPAGRRRERGPPGIEGERRPSPASAAPSRTHGLL